MSLLGRIVVILFALLVAIMAAGIALAIGIISPDWAGVDSDPVERVSFFVFAFFATSFVGAALALGTGMAAMRVMAGGHFASDAILSLIHI